MKKELATPLMLALLTIVNAWGLVMFQDYKEDSRVRDKKLFDHISNHEIHK